MAVASGVGQLGGDWPQHRWWCRHWYPITAIVGIILTAGAALRTAVACDANDVRLLTPTPQLVAVASAEVII